MADLLFDRLFKTAQPARDNYRARLFALFSEDIVRIWGANPLAPYRDLGRPTLWEGAAFATLDFTLERRLDGARFLAEQKAEMTWEKYGQLRLGAVGQVERHMGRGKRAFEWFVEAAQDPSARQVRLAARPIPVAGAILVWGAVDPLGREAAMARFGFADVLSLEGMVMDLATWRDERWQAKVAELRSWSDDLFSGLTPLLDEHEVIGG